MYFSRFTRNQFKKWIEHKPCSDSDTEVKGKAHECNDKEGWNQLGVIIKVNFCDRRDH